MNPTDPRECPHDWVETPLHGRWCRICKEPAWPEDPPKDEPRCETCGNLGLVGTTPDNYRDCPDCPKPEPAKPSSESWHPDNCMRHMWYGEDGPCPICADENEKRKPNYRSDIPPVPMRDGVAIEPAQAANMSQERENDNTSREHVAQTKVRDEVENVPPIPLIAQNEIKKLQRDLEAAKDQLDHEKCARESFEAEVERLTNTWRGHLELVIRERDAAEKRVKEQHIEIEKLKNARSDKEEAIFRERIAEQKLALAREGLERIRDTPGLGGLDFRSDKAWRKSSMEIIDKIARETLGKIKGE